MIIGGTIEYQNKCTLFVDLLLPDLTYFAKLRDAVVPNSRQVTSNQHTWLKPRMSRSVIHAKLQSRMLVCLFKMVGWGVGFWVESGGRMGCGCVVWQALCQTMSNNFQWYPFVDGDNTVRRRYNAVNFPQTPDNWHPIARPWGRGMGCVLWVWNLIYVMLLASQCRM